MKNEAKLRKEISDRVVQIYNLRKKQNRFISEKTRINYAGRIYDENEMIAAVESSLDFWLTLGKKSKEFINDFTKYMGMDFGLVTNSGSSSNLIAISALCSHNTDNHLEPDDEVITTAATFPTTLNPIIQNNLIPVFVDIEKDTYNIDASQIEQSITDRTKAIMIAHTLGNPADMNEITRIAKKYNLFLIEDTCDALGAEFAGKKCGTFGDFSTYSFYAAHHITMGEGGALLTNNLSLYRQALSIRDWGRACFCETGEKNPLGACGNRFNFKFGDLPEGYDHKYIYNNIGYNLKPLDIGCAIGVEQLKKLPLFIQKRKHNFTALYNIFKKHEEYFILPRALPESEPSWFGIPISVRSNAGFSKRDFVLYLETKNIETRMLFAGNILKHPGYRHIKYKVVSDLKNSDYAMESTFFLGVYPGITQEKLEYIEKSIDEYFKNKNT